MSLRLLLVGAVSLVLVSCGDARTGAGNEASTRSTQVSRYYLSFKNHDSRDAAQVKRYFLIAGGLDDANFAQEIIEQRRWLLGLGVPENEIACFYAIPFDEQFKDDEDQYVSLAPELANCYPAHPKFVWEQMQDGSRKTDFVYVYVTSHGSPPLRKRLEWYDHEQEDLDIINGWLARFPEIDQYRITLDALESGEPANLGDRINRLQAGDTVKNQLFTPRHLKEAILASTTEEAKKHIVVQGCYSGGFIQAPSGEYENDTLVDISNVTVMTAAKHERPSFGCGSRFYRTYFGGAFNDVILPMYTLPVDFDWESIYSRTVNNVIELEKDFVEQLDADKAKSFKPSSPMFYSNTGTIPVSR